MIRVFDAFTLPLLRRLDPEDARELRWWQRESVRAMGDYIAEAVPSLLVGLETSQRAAAEAAQRRHLEARMGQPLSVLTERGNSGRAEDFTLVRFDREIEPGRIVSATGHTSDGRALLAA